MIGWGWDVDMIFHIGYPRISGDVSGARYGLRLTVDECMCWPVHFLGDYSMISMLLIGIGKVVDAGDTTALSEPPRNRKYGTQDNNSN